MEPHVILVVFVRSTLDGTCEAHADVVVAGTIELTPIFPGSQVDFGVRIGMQEQGAASLADLAQADEAMQDAIISAGAVRPLLELTRLDSPVAQEHAARVVVGLCEQIDNQRIMVAGGAIFDLTMLLKHGSAHAMEAAAAAISSLCRNAVLAIERKGINLADLREEMSGAISSGSPSRAAHAARAQSKADSAAESPPSEVAAAAAEMPPAELEEEGSEEREGFPAQRRHQRDGEQLDARRLGAQLEDKHLERPCVGDGCAVVLRLGGIGAATRREGEEQVGHVFLRLVGACT